MRACYKEQVLFYKPASPPPHPTTTPRYSDFIAAILTNQRCYKFLFFTSERRSNF